MSLKFSLLVPTRDRHDKLRRFLDSVYKMTTKKNNLQILIGCDSCDRASQDLSNQLKKQYERQMNIEVYVRSRSEMLNEDYYNWLGHKATGDLIWILADDLELTTPGWDTIVSNSVEHFFEQHPDKVVCCSMLDNTPPPSHKLPKFPCFPMFSVRAREYCGWLLHPKVPTWGADYISYCIYKPIGRLLEFHDRNYINHISWHNKQERPDSTSKRIGNIFNKLKMVPHHNTDRILAEECPKIRNEIMDKIKAFNHQKQEA